MIPVRSRLLLVLIPLLVTVVMALLSGGGFFRRGDDRIHDFGLRLSPARSEHPRIGLVVITAQDLRRHGPWPLCRSIYARVIRRLIDDGGLAVGFDFLLDDPSPDRQDGDSRLVEQVARSEGRVVFPFEFQHLHVVEGTGTLTTRTILHRPFSELWEALSTSGFVNVPLAGVNPDGVLRRLWLIRSIPEDLDYMNETSVEEPYWQSFALAVGRLVDDRLTDEQPELVRPWYCRTMPFHTVTLDQVLRSDDPLGMKGRVVLVGAEAAELADVKTTPVGPMPGVTLNAFLLAGLLDDLWLVEPSWVVEGILVLLVGALVAFMAAILSPIATLIAVFILIIVWCGSTLGIVAGLGVALPVLGPITVAITVAPAVAVVPSRDEAEGDRCLSSLSWDIEAERMLQVLVERQEWEQVLRFIEPFDQTEGACVQSAAVARCIALARLGESRLLDLALPSLVRVSEAGLYRVARVLEEEGYLVPARDLLEQVYRRDAAFEDVAERLADLRRRARRGELAIDVKGVRELLGSRFSRVSIVAEGGMGVIFRALDGERGEYVAVKVVHPYLHKDEQALKRFLAEVRTLQGLAHPNVVRVFQVEMGRAPYYTMEFIQGETLEAALAAGPLSEARRWAVLWGVAAGLEHAHQLGIVHRDVKPANVLVGQNGSEVKVIDFGVAKTELLRGVTKEGTMVGTVEWAAPEQKRGDEVGPPADIYAFGLLMKAVGVEGEAARLADECIREDPEQRPVNLSDRLAMIIPADCRDAIKGAGTTAMSSGSRTDESRILD